VKGPHFSAPKAALQAHVTREKQALNFSKADVSRDEDASRLDASAVAPSSRAPLRYTLLRY
jgi:hypothetical protein